MRYKLAKRRYYSYKLAKRRYYVARQRAINTSDPALWREYEKALAELHLAWFYRDIP